MNPVDQLFDHLCNVMTKLDSKEIGVDDSNAQAKLVQTAVNLLNYELKRSAQTGEKIRELTTTAFNK
jgi:hypothetical protein